MFGCYYFGCLSLAHPAVCFPVPRALHHADLKAGSRSTWLKTIARDVAVLVALTPSSFHPPRPPFGPNGTRSPPPTSAASAARAKRKRSSSDADGRSGRARRARLSGAGSASSGGTNSTAGADAEAKKKHSSGDEKFQVALSACWENAKSQKVVLFRQGRLRTVFEQCVSYLRSQLALVKRSQAQNQERLTHLYARINAISCVCVWALWAWTPHLLLCCCAHLGILCLSSCENVGRAVTRSPPLTSA